MTYRIMLLVELTELPEVLASAMGDRLYLARFAEKEAMDAFISYVFATA